MIKLPLISAYLEQNFTLGNPNQNKSKNSTSRRIIKTKCIVFGIGRGSFDQGPISMPGAHLSDRRYVLGKNPRYAYVRDSNKRSSTEG